MTATNELDASSDLAVWQTEPCPPWCGGEIHGDYDHPCDRFHAGPSLKVPMRMMQAVDYGSEVAGPCWGPARLYAFVKCHSTGGTPWLHVFTDDIETSVGFDLTLAEAQQFIEALQLVIGQVTA
jgi:hypothetical protein